MNRIDSKIRKELIIEHLTSNPEIPTRTLATLLHKNHFDLFPNYDAARNQVRRLRGESYVASNKKRYYYTMPEFVRTEEQK